MEDDANDLSGSVAAALKSVEGRRQIAGLIRDTRLVLKREGTIKALGGTIRARPGLRLYINVGQARAAGDAVTVSVRFKGLEIGGVRINSDGRRIFCPSKSEAIRAVYQRWGFPAGALDGLEWRNPQLTALYKMIVAHWADLEPYASEEHTIESELIRELSAPGQRKSDSFRGIRPVLVGGYPFQFGVPLSPSGGQVVLSGRQRGHIDVLARTNVGARIALSVLELKRPGHPGKALFQAFVYACGLKHVLDSSTPASNTFMRHFGFARKWPVPIRAIAVVSVYDIPAVRLEWPRISSDPAVKKGDIIPGIIGYRYQQGRLTLEQAHWDLTTRGPAV